MDKRLLTLIPALSGRRILVIGDVILDEYLTGTATRMSREAPVPVLEFESRRHVPGGAANPAANIASLGSTPILIGIVGSDAESDALRTVLSKSRIATDSLVTDASRPTTLKTRVMAHMGLRFPQQVARMDRLSREPLSQPIETKVSEQIEDALSHADAVLVSDYQTGMLTPALVNLIREQSGEKLMTADAQGQFQKYAGFGLVKCNADEAREHLRRDLRTNADFAEAARLLYDQLALNRAMVITRGGDGATVATASAVIHCPAPAITDVYDTVGAGDTAIAVTTLGLAAGASAEEAVTLANIASGIVVRRVGNYAPTQQEIERAIRGS